MRNPMGRETRKSVSSAGVSPGKKSLDLHKVSGRTGKVFTLSSRTAARR